MYIQAILSTVQTKLRGKLKLSLNLGICGSGMLRGMCGCTRVRICQVWPGSFIFAAHRLIVVPDGFQGARYTA